MTLKEKLVKLGEENGLWPQESAQIAETLIAENGLRALEEFSKFRPELILMDFIHQTQIHLVHILVMVNVLQL
jgi:hypothetical protein